MKSLQEGMSSENNENEAIQDEKQASVNNYFNQNSETKNNSMSYLNRLNFNSINPANIIKLREV